MAIFWGLQSRFDNVKKQANAAADHPRIQYADAFKRALDYQIKYGRRGWSVYGGANDYDDSGNMRLYNLKDYDATPCDKIAPRRFQYTGYYADNFQNEIVTPYVVKIKTSRGAFICPAMAYSDCDIATIYLSKGQFAPADSDNIAHDAAVYDAAGIADGIAEREAEKSREADAQFQAEQQAEDLKEDNKNALKEARELVKAIREQRRYSNILAPICELLEDKLRELRANIRRNNARIATLSADYWQAVN